MKFEIELKSLYDIKLLINIFILINEVFVKLEDDKYKFEIENVVFKKSFDGKFEEVDCLKDEFNVLRVWINVVMGECDSVMKEF